LLTNKLAPLYRSSGPRNIQINRFGRRTGAPNTS